MDAEPVHSDLASMAKLPSSMTQHNLESRPDAACAPNRCDRDCEPLVYDQPFDRCIMAATIATVVWQRDVQ